MTACKFGYRATGARDITDLYEKSRGEGFGAEVQRRILIGTYVLSAGYYDAYYSRAQKLRTLIKRDFEQAFENCDVLLTPTTPGPAFGVGAKTADPVEMYLQDVFTVTVNLAGLPGISVPAGLTATGLPLGLQLIGKAFDEATLLRAAQAIETCGGFQGTNRPNGGPYERCTCKKQAAQRRNRRLGDRDRHGGPCPGPVPVQAVFRRLDRVRGRAQQPGLASSMPAFPACCRSSTRNASNRRSAPGWG